MFVLSYRYFVKTENFDSSGQKKHSKTYVMVLVPVGQCDHTPAIAMCSRLPYPVCT